MIYSWNVKEKNLHISHLFTKGDSLGKSISFAALRKPAQKQKAAMPSTSQKTNNFSQTK